MKFWKDSQILFPASQDRRIQESALICDHLKFCVSEGKGIDGDPTNEEMPDIYSEVQFSCTDKRGCSKTRVISNAELASRKTGARPEADFKAIERNVFTQNFLQLFLNLFAVLMGERF